MPDLKMLNSTKYLYKLTFIKCSYEHFFTHTRINLNKYEITFCHAPLSIVLFPVSF